MTLCATDAKNTTLISVSMIMFKVAAHFGISVKNIKSKIRSKTHAMPRQVAMYLASVLTDYSLPQIGRCFGRDHTTIMNGINRVTDKMVEDREFAVMILQLKDDIVGSTTSMDRNMLMALCRAMARHNPEIYIHTVAMALDILEAER